MKYLVQAFECGTENIIGTFTVMKNNDVYITGDFEKIHRNVEDVYSLEMDWMNHFFGFADFRTEKRS